MALNDADWGSTARGKVGAALTNILLNTARIKVPGPDEGGELLEVPAFYHDYVFHKGQKYGTVSWHEAFYGFMDDEHMIRATLSPVRYMPMVTPPDPGRGSTRGDTCEASPSSCEGTTPCTGPARSRC